MASWLGVEYYEGPVNPYAGVTPTRSATGTPTALVLIVEGLNSTTQPDLLPPTGWNYEGLVVCGTPNIGYAIYSAPATITDGGWRTTIASDRYLSSVRFAIHTFAGDDIDLDEIIRVFEPLSIAVGNPAAEAPNVPAPSVDALAGEVVVSHYYQAQSTTAVGTPTTGFTRVTDLDTFGYRRSTLIRNVSADETTGTISHNSNVAYQGRALLSMVIGVSSGPTPVTSATDVALAVQLARSATLGLSTAVQAPQSASTSLALAVRAARTATSSVALAIEQAASASTLVRLAVQAAGSASTSVAAALQVARSASADLDLAVQQAQSAGADVSLQVQAAHDAGTDVSLMVQAGVSASVAVNVAVQALRTATMALTVAVSQENTASTSVATAVRDRHTAGTSVSLQVQEDGAMLVMVQVAVQFAASAAASLSVAVAEARSAGASVAAALALRHTAGVAASIAKQIRRLSTLGVSVYVFDPESNVTYDQAFIVAPPARDWRVEGRQRNWRVS